MLALELTQHQFGYALAPLPKSEAGSVGLIVLMAFALEGIWRLARHIMKRTDLRDGFTLAQRLQGGGIFPALTGEQRDGIAFTQTQYLYVAHHIVGQRQRFANTRRNFEIKPWHKG